MTYKMKKWQPFKREESIGMGVANGRSQVMGRVNGRSQVMAERSVYSNFSILIPYTSRQDGG